LPGTSGAGTAARGGGGATVGPLVLLVDAEVGRENPAEAKAAKLARSLTRGLVDKRLKPDTEERRRIEVVLEHPPNRRGRGGWGAGKWRRVV
jgi:phosphatidylinositol 3-kinase